MKRRARRITTVAAVLGAGVLAVLVVAHWGTVRNHVEGWWYLLTTQTVTVEFDRRGSPARKTVKSDPYQGFTMGLCLEVAATYSDRPILMTADPRVVIGAFRSSWLSPQELDGGAPSRQDAISTLEARGWRFMKLQFPCVIIAYRPAQ